MEDPSNASFMGLNFYPHRFVLFCHKMELEKVGHRYCLLLFMCNYIQMNIVIHEMFIRFQLNKKWCVYCKYTRLELVHKYMSSKTDYFRVSMLNCKYFVRTYDNTPHEIFKGCVHTAK